MSVPMCAYQSKDGFSFKNSSCVCLHSQSSLFHLMLTFEASLCSRQVAVLDAMIRPAKAMRAVVVEVIVQDSDVFG